MKIKILVLSAAAVILAGCFAPPPAQDQNVVPSSVTVKVEKFTVQARRGELMVELTNKRGAWADECMRNRAVPMMFEADRAVLCVQRAADIYPDTVTYQLLSEFGGDIYQPQVK